MPAPKKKPPATPKAGSRKDKREHSPVSRTQRASRGTGRPRGR